MVIKKRKVFERIEIVYQPSNHKGDYGYPSRRKVGIIENGSWGTVSDGSDRDSDNLHEFFQ